MTYMSSLQAKTKDELVNDAYNAQVASWADYADKQEDQHGHGKRIPYLGWFWRNTGFVNKRVSIGDAGGFIGVMENNKWDYPEREMTEQEVDAFMGYLERAFHEAGQGGNVAELHKKADAVFTEMWAWFQTLTI
jgi:hypothetical protein